MEVSLMPQATGSRALSLRTRLILLVMASVLPLLVFTVVRRYADYQESLAQIGERNLALARSMALLLDEELQVRIAALRAIARAPALQASSEVASFRPRAERIAQEEFPGANLMLLQQDG